MLPQLILPDWHIPNLASHLLALNLKRLSHDWQNRHGHPVLLAETFVDRKSIRLLTIDKSLHHIGGKGGQFQIPNCGQFADRLDPPAFEDFRPGKGPRQGLNDGRLNRFGGFRDFPVQPVIFSMDR
jgi:hypothetical protein